LLTKIMREVLNTLQRLRHGWPWEAQLVMREVLLLEL
jgi:hypothetical protein